MRGAGAGPRAFVGRDLAGADARVGVLRLQQQLDALDRRDGRLGHRARHTACKPMFPTTFFIVGKGRVPQGAT